MDRLTFLAALVKALAWPLTVLGIFLVMRRPLLALVPLLARLRFKDLELDFGRRLAEASAEAATLPATRSVEPRTDGDEALLQLARASPRAAILEAWLRFEAAVFHELRSLRNSAAHALGFEPAPAAAHDYVRLAGRLEQSLDDGEGAA